MNVRAPRQRPHRPADNRCQVGVLVLVLAVAPGLAAATPAMVRAMLENAPTAAENRCSYTRTRYEGSRSRRERYHAADPRTPWALEQINGREPSPEELRRYARDAGERDRRHPLAFDLRSMVDPQHWRLRSETDDQAVFEFRLRPNEDLDERLVDKVLGTLIVDKERHQPLRITIENTEPAYIAPFVRVAEYLQDMRFRWNEAVGAAVLTSTETRWRGRALGLKVLEEHKWVNYSDYQCAGAVADLQD